jgi:hypothetical protein
MAAPNDHIAEVRAEGRYVELERDNDRFGDGIDVVWGVRPAGEAGPQGGRTEIQSLRFDSSRFGQSDVKEWLDRYDIEYEFVMGSQQSQTQEDDEEERENGTDDGDDLGLWMLGIGASAVMGTALRSAMQNDS